MALKTTQDFHDLSVDDAKTCGLHFPQIPPGFKSAKAEGGRDTVDDPGWEDSTCGPTLGSWWEWGWGREEQCRWRSGWGDPREIHPLSTVKGPRLRIPNSH